MGLKVVYLTKGAERTELGNTVSHLDLLVVLEALHEYGVGLLSLLAQPLPGRQDAAAVLQAVTWKKIIINKLAISQSNVLECFTTPQDCGIRFAKWKKLQEKIYGPSNIHPEKKNSYQCE
jgi:hypothetical protein